MAIMDNGKPDRRKIGFEKQVDDPAQFSILTEKEKDAIREKARLLVLNELKDREEKALLEQYTKEERQKTDPDQVLVPIWLTLAPSQGEYLLIDNTKYFNEVLHHVTPAVFTTLTEMQARGWAHEEDTEVRDAKSRRRSRPPPHVGVGNFVDNRQPRDLVVTSGQLQGASAPSLLGIRA